MVVQLALDESDQPGAVLPVKLLDLGRHTGYVPTYPRERNGGRIADRFSFASPAEVG